MTKYSYSTQDSINPLWVRLDINVNDNNEVESWHFFVESQDSLEEIEELGEIKDSIDHEGIFMSEDDIDYTKNVEIPNELDGNRLSGFFHIPTQTFIGIDWWEDSWDDEFNGKVFTKLELIEKYKPVKLNPSL